MFGALGRLTCRLFQRFHINYILSTSLQQVNDTQTDRHGAEAKITTSSRERKHNDLSCSPCFFIKILEKIQVRVGSGGYYFY